MMNHCMHDHIYTSAFTVASEIWLLLYALHVVSPPMTISTDCHGLLYIDLLLQKPPPKDPTVIAFLQYEPANTSHKHTNKTAHPHQALPLVSITTTSTINRLRPTPRSQNSLTIGRYPKPA
jgi:hypothetical protein